MAKRSKQMSGAEVLKLIESSDFDDDKLSDLDGASDDDEPMIADIVVAGLPAINVTSCGRGEQLTGIDPRYRDSVLFDDVQVCIHNWLLLSTFRRLYMVQWHSEAG